MKCPRCGQERPDVDNEVSKAWGWLHSPPGYIRMSWPELKAAANEFARSHNIVQSLIAAALSESTHENYD